MKLYHSTQLRFLDEIIKNGLKPGHPLQREHKPKGIYLSEYMFNWTWNSTRSGKFKGAVLKVDVTGFPLIDDYHDNKKDVEVNSKSIGKDFICMHDIPTERIIEIYIETEMNTFKKLTGWKHE